MPYHLRNGIYAHPFELVACVSTLLAVWGGGKLLVTQPETLDRLDSGILSMPHLLLWSWIAMGACGAVLTAGGLGMSVYSHKGRAIEATGLWLMGAMWLSSGVALVFLDWMAWEAYVRYFAIAGGCVLRLLVLNQFHAIMTKIPVEDNESWIKEP